MRRTQTAAVTPQMYRHFATVTLAITILVAVFANGENQEAIAAEAHHETAERQAKKDQAHPTPKPEKEPASVDTGIWGSDEGRAFGQPMMSASAQVGAWASSAAASWQSDLVSSVPHQLTKADHDQLARALARRALPSEAANGDQNSNTRTEVVAVGGA